MNPKVRSQLKTSALQFQDGKTQSFIIRKRKVGKQKEFKLILSLDSRSHREFGAIDGVGFLFEWHGVFVHKGVGRGYKADGSVSVKHPSGNPRVPVVRGMVHKGSLLVKVLMGAVDIIGRYRGAILTTAAAYVSYPAAVRLLWLWESRKNREKGIDVDLSRLGNVRRKGLADRQVEDLKDSLWWGRMTEKYHQETGSAVVKSVQVSVEYARAFLSPEHYLSVQAFS